MPRGGARYGAGRKPKLQRLAALYSPEVAAAHAPAPAKKPPKPANWPFGTVDPEPAPMAPPVAAPALPLASRGPEIWDIETETSLELFQKIYRDKNLDLKLRLQAAAQALPFENARPAPLGIKDAKAAAAKKAGGGKFAAAAPPLKLVGRDR